MFLAVFRGCCFRSGSDREGRYLSAISRGMGYVEEYPIARYFRDVRLLSIGGGADEVMLEVIAKLAGISPKS